MGRDILSLPKRDIAVVYDFDHAVTGLLEYYPDWIYVYYDSVSKESLVHLFR